MAKRMAMVPGHVLLGAAGLRTAEHVGDAWQGWTVGLAGRPRVSGQCGGSTLAAT